MPEQPPKRCDVPAAPPRLERVQSGSPSAPGSAVGGGARASGTPASGGGQAPGATYGLRPREVGADAAFAASIAHEGTLETESALRLFYLAAATQASGRLTLGDPARPFTITLKRGTALHATSADPEDALEAHLVRRGVVTAEAAARARAAGGDFAAALIGLGLVAPADAAGALQEHATALLTRALAVEAGRWRWEPGVAPPPSSFPLGNSWALLPAAVRTLDPAAVKRRLGDREERVATRVGGRIRAEDLRLTPQETRLLGAFDGIRSVAELAVAHHAEAAILLRLALLLGETELLAFGAIRKAAPAATAAPKAPAAGPAAPPPHPAPSPPPRPAAAAPKPPAPKPAAPAATPKPPNPAAKPPAVTPKAPAPAAAPALDAAALKAVKERIANADHFEVLGLKRDANAAAIKAAYFSLAKRYHPDTVPPGASPEVRQLCAEIFSRVGEAWSVLGDDKQRAEYLEALATGGTEKIDVQAIFQAENTFQQGTLLVKARRYAEARDAFVEAIRLNPDEAEFAIWKAWCDFVLADDRKRQHTASAAAIEAALKRNPRCAPGYLFLGQMAKIVGDLALAERQLKRGLALAPDDTDLQRELKYLRK